MFLEFLDLRRRAMPISAAPENSSATEEGSGVACTLQPEPQVKEVMVPST